MKLSFKLNNADPLCEIVSNCDVESEKGWVGGNGLGYHGNILVVTEHPVGVFQFYTGYSFRSVLHHEIKFYH